jgi:hypothetical protein
MKLSEVATTVKKKTIPQNETEKTPISSASAKKTFVLSLSPHMKAS